MLGRARAAFLAEARQAARPLRRAWPGAATRVPGMAPASPGSGEEWRRREEWPESTAQEGLQVARRLPVAALLRAFPACAALLQVIEGLNGTKVSTSTFRKAATAVNSHYIVIVVPYFHNSSRLFPA